MGAEDGARAWAYLKRSPDYRAAWAEHAARPAFEAGAAFPVRVQGETDRAALRFAMLAWQDPDAGAISPFWEEAPMLAAELLPGGRPLAALAGETGATVEGLRLEGGTLVVKIERAPRVAQVCIAGIGAVPADAALVVRLDYALPLPVAIGSLADLWSVVHGPDPRRRAGARAGTTASA